MQELELEAAKARLRRAIELAPEFPQAHFNLALIHLLQGDYRNGWAEYEWRTRAPGYADYAHFAFGMPRWRGEPLAGKAILVHGEQGFGDTIQFARFLTRASKEARAVDLFCQPSLAPLLGRIEGVRQAHGSLDERPTQDLHAPVMDFGAYYLPSADSPRWDGPYITPLRDRVDAWAPRLAHLPRPRIGLVWKGSAKNVGDRKRSLTGADIVTVMIEGASFVSLQMDSTAGDLPAGIALDAAAWIRDWDDTAAVLHHLDLLVTVDTAVAHLAGAMGKPVWTLVPYSPDWRWGLEAEATAWYPTMRLFRQPRIDAWAPVLARVDTELRKLLK